MIAHACPSTHTHTHKHTQIANTHASARKRLIGDVSMNASSHKRAQHIYLSLSLALRMALCLAPGAHTRTHANSLTCMHTSMHTHKAHTTQLIVTYAPVSLPRYLEWRSAWRPLGAHSRTHANSLTCMHTCMHTHKAHTTQLTVTRAPVSLPRSLEWRSAWRPLQCSHWRVCQAPADDVCEKKD